MHASAAAATPLRPRPCVGVLDIGSNSVRLVLYEAGQRLPLPLFNDKEICALGTGLDASGVLNPEGVPLALETVERFVALARAAGAEQVDALATAAVREARDGPEFVRTLEERFGLSVRVLTGAEEARLAAEGVACGTPAANGLVADMGGGSLDLVDLTPEAITGVADHHATAPLGALRLVERSGGKVGRVAALVDHDLGAVPWISGFQGRTLYAVGGTWRSVARVCMSVMGYPLTVLDSFTLSGDEARAHLRAVARMETRDVERVEGVSRRRAAQVPFGAAALETLLNLSQASCLTFSIFGMREGWYYEQLPAPIRAEDPLESLCARYEAVEGRFPGTGTELIAWTDALFPEETPCRRRLRHAACLLGDVFWHIHPDYRAEHAFQRILRLPFMGLSHMDRVTLALAVFLRYQPNARNELAQRAHIHVDEDHKTWATLMGRALRLGCVISGGMGGVLPRTALALRDGELEVTLPADAPWLVTQQVRRRVAKNAHIRVA